MTHIVVIGAGVIGVATAAELARRGLRVTLLERRIRASADPCFLIWAARFLANCSSARFSANTLAVLRLALRSRSVLAALRARHPDLTFNHSNSGKLHLYDDAGKFQTAKEGMAFKNGFGCDQRALTPSEVVGILTIMTGMAVERFVVEGHRIRAVETQRGLVEADLFILTAGTDAPVLARTVEISLPIYPVKGYSVTLPATCYSPRISITDTRARIVFCRLGKNVRIAGMADLGAPNLMIQRDRIDLLMAVAQTCLPSAADWSADPQFWTGLRPMTPDSRPIIGATLIANLFLNCGHGMLGRTLACGSAELIAAEILGESQAMTEDFSLARF